MFDFSFDGAHNAANFISGIDEAGRGPVIGPLILCCACSSKDPKRLLDLGVKDSKQLTKQKREEIFSKLLSFCSIYFIKISAEQLNTLMDEKSLNQIEAEAMAALIKKSGSKETIIDMPDRSLETFTNRLLKEGIFNSQFKASHKADQLFPIVSAASIGAKVTRDQEIEKITTEIGFDFGSGYPSDPKTIEALFDNIKRKKLQKYLRTKWKTLDKFNIDSKQKDLTEF